jgi:hypothetical protein
MAICARDGGHAYTTFVKQMETVAEAVKELVQ